MVWSLGIFQSEHVLLPPPAHSKFVTKKDVGKTHGVKGFLKISVQNYLLDKWHTVNGERGRELQALREPAAWRCALHSPSVPPRSLARLSPAPGCTGAKRPEDSEEAVRSARCRTLKSGGLERREQRTVLLSSHRETMGTYPLACRAPLCLLRQTCAPSGSEFRWGFLTGDGGKWLYAGSGWTEWR